MTTTVRPNKVLKFASIPPAGHPITGKDQLERRLFPNYMIKTLLARAGYTGDALDTRAWREVNIREDNTLEVVYLSSEQVQNQNQGQTPAPAPLPDRFDLVNALMSAQSVLENPAQSNPFTAQEYRTINAQIQELIDQARTLAD